MTPSALDLARCELKNEQKSKEEAKGLATTLAEDVGTLQREKMVLEEQVNGEALVTFLVVVQSQFSDTLRCSAWAALQRQLSEMRGQLQSESDDHDALCVAVGLVFNDLRVAPVVETSSLTVWVTQIPDWVCALAREALHTGVHPTFAVAHSHYIDIDLPMISEGFTSGYTDTELDEIEMEAAPPAQDLAGKIREDILPKSV